MQEKTEKQQSTTAAGKPAAQTATAGKHLLDALGKTLMAAVFHWWMTLCSLPLSGEYRTFVYFARKAWESKEIIPFVITIGSQACAVFCLVHAAKDIGRAIRLSFKKN